jgi:hypothetical protein
MPKRAARRPAAAKTRKKRQSLAAPQPNVIEASAGPASAAPKDCCTIESPDGPDRDIEVLTQAELNTLQNTLPLLTALSAQPSAATP